MILEIVQNMTINRNTVVKMMGHCTYLSFQLYLIITSTIRHSEACLQYVFQDSEKDYGKIVDPAYAKLTDGEVTFVFLWFVHILVILAPGNK